MANLTKPALRVNGIPISVSAQGGVTLSMDELVPTTERNSLGSIVGSRRGFKRSVTVKTAPWAWDEATAVHGVVEGKGFTADFGSSPFLGNGWLTPVITGTAGRFLSSTSPYIYPSGSFSGVSGTGTNYLQWTGILGLLSGKHGASLTFWAKNLGSAAQAWMSLLNASASDTGIAVSLTSTGALSFAVPGVTTLVSAALTWGSDWHQVTCVVRDTTVSNYNCMEIYFDGVLVASYASTGRAFLLNDRSVCQIGPLSATVNMALDEMAVFPFPLIPEFSVGLYLSQTPNAATSLGAQSTTPRERNQMKNFPQVWLSGDDIPDPFYAVGHVVGTQVLTAYRDPVTQAVVGNGKTMDLQFLEV